MSVRISIFRRKPELSQAEFTAYWRDVHAPIAVMIPALQLYEQNYVVERYGFGDLDIVQSADGFCKLRFADETAMRGVMSPEMTRVLMEDEAKFIEGLRTFVVRSNPVLHPSSEAALKCMALVTRNAASDTRTFERVWSGAFARLIEALPGVAGYAQHFVIDRTASRCPVSYEQSPIDCIDEFWLTHPSASPQGHELLREIQDHASAYVEALSLAVVTVNLPPIPKS